MNKRDYGKVGETTAGEYLKARGYEIIGRNVYVGRCEIDLIAVGHGLLLFVEVKTRRQEPGGQSVYGRPGSALTKTKRENLIAAATGYIHEHPEIAGDLQPRIDLIEVYADPHSEEYGVLDVVHIPNAVHK